MSLTYHIDDTGHLTPSAGKGQFVQVSTYSTSASSWAYAGSVLKEDPLAEYVDYTTPNWDGFGAEPITVDTIDAARRLLRHLEMFGGLDDPDIAPGADGTIGFEWKFRSGPIAKIFIDIGPGQVMSAYRRWTNGKTDNWTPHSLGLRAYSTLPDLFAAVVPGV